ncbi:cation diffusion facilitator family transporter [Chitinophagaceae bacterium MMS25-I14]
MNTEQNMTVRVQRTIAIVSIVIFLAKIWAYYLTHSVTILTDALESTVNVIAGLIGLYSVILAAKPRDLNHPYGHGKIEFVSAAIEGALILIAGLMIIYEAGDQLFHPRQLHKLNIGIVIIVLTGFLNFALGTYAVSIGQKNRSLTLEAAGKHLRTDAYSTFAIVAGLAILYVTKWRWIDSLVAIVFACIIVVTGYRVVRRSLAGIMDEADEKLLKQVIDMLQANRKPQWVDLHNLRVIQYGDILHIDAHMTLPWYYQVKDAEVEIHGLEDMIRKEFGGKVELFIHIDACMPYQCSLCAHENCPVRAHYFTGQIPWTTDNVWANEKHGKNGVLTD